MGYSCLIAPPSSLFSIVPADLANADHEGVELTSAGCGARIGAGELCATPKNHRRRSCVGNSASTLLAATPFLECRCPGDASNADKSSCCKGTCCFANESGKSCCCHKNTADRNNDKAQATGAKKSDNGPIIAGGSCQKALVQHGVSALSQQDNKLTQSSFAPLHLHCATPCGAAALVSLPRSVGRLTDSFAPPTDLVTSLQRLTI